ncbi:MAG: UvrD-helicase domain-containing protein [Hydrogenophaga sp.]|uniref:UvrD-helicase domain-containing protein n=1 Tax=Hydrogenophaga sp. TaxID=1904254 RepID=UPI0025B7D792|nr:UvrD-helicase domain-containing protein [Hydrogenophaga sp.]MBT9551949.1 UvrD-helicase domain-containing protein [Hydrogenophaga sp.]
MNPFQRARNEALAIRTKLASTLSPTAVTAKDLLENVESVLNIAIESVPPAYSDLGGGTAVLQREQMFIYVSSEVESWSAEFCGLVAHELGHYFLDSTKQATTVTHLSKLLGSAGSPAVLQVEAYGARERQELQANVFARELLLPRNDARQFALAGKGPAKTANELGIPLEFVRQQMLDGLLLPEATATTSPLSEPSPDQRAAAMAQERAANVVAGPGTGKTTTLIHRVKYLVEDKQVHPSQILVLTFTNKAAFELVERLRNAGIADASEIWAGTFHSFGLEFLRKYHQHFSLDSDLHVSDLMGSMTNMVKALPRVELNHFLRVEDPYEWLGPVIDGITRLKEELVTPSAYRHFVEKNEDDDEELQQKRLDVATLFELYETLLKERQTVDFVDLISKPANALREDRKPFVELVDRFEHVLVDEYQDVTQAMVELLRQLAYKKNIWVVGDIRQAIHHWRGASLKSLLKFDTEFKAHAGGSAIQRYPLTYNRRSSQEVVDLTQKIGREHVLESSLKLDDVFATHGASGAMPVVVSCSESDAILGAVSEHVRNLEANGVPFGGQAVLCRKTSDVERAAELLEQAGIPIVYVGELNARTEVKHLLCLIQLLVERRPKALVGLSGIPTLNMPLIDIEILKKAAENDVSFQRGRWIHTPPPGLSSRGLEVTSNLRKLIGKYQHGSNPWAVICDLLLEQRLGLPPFADTSVRAWVSRIALWQFAYSVRNGDGEMKEARLSRYFLRQRLRQRIGDAQGRRELPPEAAVLNGVRVMTVHGSKGLEFDAVHVGFVSSDSYGSQAPSWSPDGILDIVPPEALGSSLDEYKFEASVERNNLLYVAVSRAKRHLFLYQDTKFKNSTAPQLNHFPKKFQPETYKGLALTKGKSLSSGAFVPPTAISFEDFYSYATCSLRYWYTRVLELQSESDIDTSLRAKWAVMDALKAFSSGSKSTPERALEDEWIAKKLPPSTEDPSLWSDAIFALKRGEAHVIALRKRGGTFEQTSAVIGGLTLQMPWGFRISGTYGGTEFAILRFSRRGISEYTTILKPLLQGICLPGPVSISLHHVLSDKTDAVPGTRSIEMTKSYKAALRFATGDNSPMVGRHCGRCDFSSICPSIPT